MRRFEGQIRAVGGDGDVGKAREVDGIGAGQVELFAAADTEIFEVGPHGGFERRCLLQGGVGLAHARQDKGV